MALGGSFMRICTLGLLTGGSSFFLRSLDLAKSGLIISLLPFYELSFCVGDNPNFRALLT